MKSRTKTPPAAPAPALAGTLAPAAFADAQRQQMTVAGEAAGAMLRGVEAIRQIQERSALEAVERHSKAARHWAAATDPAALLLAHANLLREDLEAAGQYWQEMAASALETQCEIAACCAQLVESDAALEAASAFGP
jgi:hypothetical protein